MRKKLFFLIPIILCVLILSMCHHRNQSVKVKSHLITVSSQSLSNTFFYAGNLQPLNSVVVTTPTEGVIEKMSFHYGDYVKAGQVLFVMDSEKFQSDYKTALMQYIKAKNDFNSSQTQLKEGEFLHSKQLISDDDYKTKKNSFYNSQLSLLEAKDALTRLLKQLDVKGFNFYDLTIADIDKITAALHLQADSQKIQIIAPTSGIALLPTKSDNTSDKKIAKGEQVKQGDVLAVIGDGKGFSLHVSVSEFDVNQLKIGQAVKVTGAAFPDYVLQGKISGVEHQGQSNQSGIPNFSVEIIIPKLSEAEEKNIHVGMSAKAEVNVAGESAITLPIAAVFEKQGSAFVKVKNKKNNTISDVQVTTGKTSLDSIVILSHLNVGDQVVVAD